MRIALGLEYCGCAFSGWQIQSQTLSYVRTVQQVVEKAIASVANQPVRIYCAGRTDKGVHSSGQVIHFDTDVFRSEHSWVFGCNTYLSEDVSVLWARKISNNFHARFSAIRRRYSYVLLNRRIRPGVLHGRVAWDYRVLDIEVMRQAALFLIGKHDFSSFRAAGCQAKNPVKEIFALEIIKRDDYLIIDIEADGFLYKMVRNIIGLLLEIGVGNYSVSFAKETLDQKKRTNTFPTAPSGGLYLTAIYYPDSYSVLPVTAKNSFLDVFLLKI